MGTVAAIRMDVVPKVGRGGKENYPRGTPASCAQLEVSEIFGGIGAPTPACIEGSQVVLSHPNCGDALGRDRR